jgi:berberine-like enzyme
MVPPNVGIVGLLGETCRRLSAVKAQYDPEDTFQANQPIASPW